MKKSISLFTLCALALIFTGCTQNTTIDNTTSSSHANASSDAQPVLYNLGGIDLERDVEFNAHVLDVARGKTAAVFLFGQPLPQNPGEPQRINPNLEFGGIKTPIELISALNGVVAFIKEQPETNDYEVFLQTEENSTWIVGYDHVTDLRVTKGQQISVGDVLGKAAIENNGYYRYEIQINHETNNETTMICPTDLLDASVRTTEKAKIDAFVERWNTSYRAVYNDDSYTTQSGGCIKSIVTNAESQGQ